jgi:putative peptide zinc metalloprotease protein
MSDLKPKFRPDIITHPFDEKAGGRSCVLEDPVANKFYRISLYELDFLRALNGNVTIPQAIEKLKIQGRYFTAEHARALAEQFSRAGLLLGTPQGSSTYQSTIRKRIEHQEKSRRLTKLFFLYVPLVSPDRFLERTLWLWRLLVNRVTKTLFLLLIPPAIYLLIIGISRMRGDFSFFFNLENLLYLWIAIAGVKLAHEFSHAYTAKSYGLRVPQMGVAFLIFFPCLYCDTTAAWQLADRRQRIAISLAGIAAEAVTAVISVYIWYFTKPGVLHSTAFFMMAVSLISSLLFNGNPLMRFDGYFALIDVLRMPNLQSSALSHVKYLFYNQVLGIQSVSDVNADEGERRILTVYGVSAVVYRVLLYSGIIVGVYYRFDKTVGIVLGALALSLFVIKPAVNGVVGLAKRRSEMQFRPKGLIVVAVVIGAFVLIVTRPLSMNSVFPCYVDTARTQQIVIPADAPVASVHVRKGDRVTEGSVVFELDGTYQAYQLKEHELDVRLVKTEIAVIEGTGEDLSRLDLKHIELEQAVDSLQQTREELDNLRWEAPFSGIITDLLPDFRPGAQPGKGAVVGELQSTHECEIVGLIPEEDVHRIRTDRRIEAWFPLRTGVTVPLDVVEISRFREQDLEGSPFSSRFGGEIATQIKGPEDLDSPLESYYVCRAAFTDNESIPLGLTGRMVVSRPPRSILDRAVETVHKTFFRETIF